MDLNHQQKRLFLFEQQRVKGGSFSVPVSFEFTQKLDSICLKRALDYLVKRHENLSFVFAQTENGPKIIKKNQDFNVSIKSFSNFDETRDFIRKNAREPFDLFKGPLYRFIICEVANTTILYLNVHHLIWDGTSTSIFMNEVNKVYSSFIKNESPKLKELESNRYSSYTERAESVYANTLKNQKENLESFYRPLEILQTPIDYKRPTELIHEGDMTEFELEENFANNIKNYCLKHKISIYSFFSSCFTILLNRFSSKNKFYLGTPHLGRFSKQDLTSLGFYVHTGLIPCEVDQKDNLLYFMLAHHQNVLKCQQFSRLPLEELTSLVDKYFDRSRTQGYQAFYMFQDFSNKKLKVHEAEYKRIHLDSGIAQSDLDLWISVYRDSIKGGIHFPKCLFKKSTIELLQIDLLFIIESVLGEKIDKLSEITISNQHQDYINQEFHNFTKDETKSVLDYFAESFKIEPDKVAVVSSGKSYSYKELDELSSKFSQNLLDRGIKKGDLVAVSMDRSADLMIALIGILKTDCFYLPVDAKFPIDRIQYMIEHSGATQIVVDRNTEKTFTEIQKVLFEEFLEKSSQIKLNNSYESKGNQSAYVIYTSGSTGKPKGVEISIHAMTNFLLSMKNEPGIKLNDTLCAVTTLSFDISVLELYLPLISGATVFIASSEEAKNSQLLANIIAHHNITIMQATPITWRLLFNSGWDGKNDLKVLCGGEKMPTDLSKELIRSCESLWNMYGPTETTVWSTCKQLRDDNELITIGKPIKNTSILILNEKLMHVPVGSVGEIYIGGEGLATGYLHRPDLTQERFVDFNGQKIYKTGDHGRFASWGEVFCLGRLDHQVKIRGHRIELGEIEYQISLIEQIKQSIVIIREDIPGDKRLVAYIALGEPISENKIKEHILTKLPPYMLPEHFVFIDKMPLTPNGKIDQKALPAPYSDREKVDEDLTLPESKTERKIAEIWKNELGIPNVYLEDNFFDIGGNSLVAASVFHSISQVFKCNLELALLFEFPNLTLLAKEVDELVSGKKRKFSNLIKLNEGNKNKNMFFFHAIGGNTLNYRVFVEHADNFNCYGVQSDGVDGHNIKINTVEAMAENYVRQILKIDPDGPYYLVGGSLGGLLAYEVARLLLNRRKKVMPVIMFDTAVPQRKRSKVDQKNRQEAKSFRTFGVDQMRRRILGGFNHIYKAFRIPTPITIRVPLLEYYNFLALKKYRPKDFDGDVYMIRIPIKEKGIYSRKDLGWGDYVLGKIDVDFIDAPHHEFIESKDVAKVFGDYLKKL